MVWVVSGRPGRSARSPNRRNNPDSGGLVGGLVGGWSSPILQAYLTVSWSQVRVSQSQSSVAKRKSLRVEREMAAAAQAGSSGMPNQTGQIAEAAGGGVQAGSRSGAPRLPDLVSVNFGN